MVIPEHDEAPVLYERDGHVATISLNRPHRRNAISMPMLRMLSAHLADADEDRDVRVILLTGRGKGFCSGLDIKDAAGGSGIGGRAAQASGPLPNLRTLPTIVLNELDTPVIGVLNGAAAGYGLDLALGCDIRLMAASARLLPGFAKLGVIPESGGTWYLPRLIGWARAMEVSFLGRPLSAAEVLDFGLVNRVVPDDELVSVARSWAEEIAANAPLALRAMRRLFRHGLTEDFASHSHHVLLQTLELFRTRDFQEGLAALTERRAPSFEGR